MQHLEAATRSMAGRQQTAAAELEAAAISGGMHDFLLCRQAMLFIPIIDLTWKAGLHDPRDQSP